MFLYVHQFLIHTCLYVSNFFYNKTILLIDLSQMMLPPTERLIGGTTKKVIETKLEIMNAASSLMVETRYSTITMRIK